MQDDQLIKISGAGEAGERGAEHGDLYVRVKILPHNFFTRHGDDLLARVGADLVRVLLGERIEIPTIGGNKLHLEIPRDFNLKDRLRVPGEGMARFGGYGRGDLYVEWDVRTPKRMSAQAKKLLEDLKKELE